MTTLNSRGTDDHAAHRGVRARPGGFTLIELMVVVAVAALLATVAYPSYVNQVRKSRRADAKTALLDLAARQERFFSINNTYTSNGSNLGYAGAFPQNVLTGSTAYYQLNVTAASATAYTLSATPIGDQTADPCGSYGLDQSGNQTTSGGTLSTASCW